MWKRSKVKGHTNALHEGWVQPVCEKRFWQLPEIQFQCPCYGINVHVTQHHQDIFGIWERETERKSKWFAIITNADAGWVISSRHDIWHNSEQHMKVQLWLVPTDSVCVFIEPADSWKGSDLCMAFPTTLLLLLDSRHRPPLTSHNQRLMGNQSKILYKMLLE